MHVGILLPVPRCATLAVPAAPAPGLSGPAMGPARVHAVLAVIHRRLQKDRTSLTPTRQACAARHRRQPDAIVVHPPKPRSLALPITAPPAPITRNAGRGWRPMSADRAIQRRRTGGGQPRSCRAAWRSHARSRRVVRPCVVTSRPCAWLGSSSRRASQTERGRGEARSEGAIAGAVGSSVEVITLCCAARRGKLEIGRPEAMARAPTQGLPEQSPRRARAHWLMTAAEVHARWPPALLVVVGRRRR